jgi:hypothetical protein
MMIIPQGLQSSNPFPPITNPVSFDELEPVFNLTDETLLVSSVSPVYIGASVLNCEDNEVVADYSSIAVIYLFPETYTTFLGGA